MRHDLMPEMKYYLQAQAQHQNDFWFNISYAK